MSESTPLKALVQCNSGCAGKCAICGADRNGNCSYVYTCEACSKRFKTGVCCVCKKQKTNRMACMCTKCHKQRKINTCFFCGCKGKDVPNGRWV